MTPTSIPGLARPLALLLASCALTPGCVVPPTSGQAGAFASPGAAEWTTFVPTLPVSHPPFTEFHPGWVQRLDTPYVYVDHYGSYADTGAHIPALLREMYVQGLESDDPPFCLFYDDPALVPVDRLRSRACVPISAPRSPRTPLKYDVLPSRSVAYAYVTGPYTNAPRCYPKLFEYMAKFHWVQDGPICETYIVPPGEARAVSDLLCKVQIPVANGD